MKKSNEFRRNDFSFMSRIAHRCSLIYAACASNQNQWSNSQKHTIAPSCKKFAKKGQNVIFDEEVKWILEKWFLIHDTHRPWMLPDLLDQGAWCLGLICAQVVAIFESFCLLNWLVALFDSIVCCAKNQWWLQQPVSWITKFVPFEEKMAEACLWMAAKKKEKWAMSTRFHETMQREKVGMVTSGLEPPDLGDFLTSFQSMWIQNV